LSGWWLASYFVLWAVVIVLAVLVVALARQIGTLHLRLGPRGALEMDDEGPALGEAPPHFELADIDGRTRHIGGPGEAQLLLFVSPGCSTCEHVLPGVSAAAGMGRLAPYVLTDVDRQESELALKKKRLGAPIVPAAKAARAYEVPGTPYVVMLDEQGVVQAKGTVNNLEQLEGLIDTGRQRIEDNISQRQAADVR
jgi:methylamine dehydrogenase accessory protein MauD